MTQILLIVLGWLLGILSPGVVEAISRRKRKTETIQALATELDDLRYKLALVDHRVRCQSGRLDKSSLALIKGIVIAHAGPEEDSELAAGFKKLLELGEDTYIALHDAESQKNPGLWPVPYEAPFLQLSLAQLSLYSPKTQAAVLRTRSELHLFNQQLAQVQKLHDLTFSLTGSNHAINQGNLKEASYKLATRAESLIWAIDQLVDANGRPLRTDR